jgi:hypothetical protein
LSRAACAFALAFSRRSRSLSDDLLAPALGFAPLLLLLEIGGGLSGIPSLISEAARFAAFSRRLSCRAPVLAGSQVRRETRYRSIRRTIDLASFTSAHPPKAFATPPSFFILEGFPSR